MNKYKWYSANKYRCIVIGKKTINIVFIATIATLTYEGIQCLLQNL